MTRPLLRYFNVNQISSSPGFYIPNRIKEINSQYSALRSFLCALQFGDHMLGECPRFGSIYHDGVDILLEYLNSDFSLILSDYSTDVHSMVSPLLAALPQPACLPAPTPYCHHLPGRTAPCMYVCSTTSPLRLHWGSLPSILSNLCEVLTMKFPP